MARDFTSGQAGWRALLADSEKRLWQGGLSLNLQQRMPNSDLKWASWR